jgi:RND family efflux transporter MFP subunit
MRLPVFIVSITVIAMLSPWAGDAEPLSRIVTGDVIANRTVTLATRIMGRITMIHAEEGDKVEAGQMIVELDDAEYQAKLRSAEAALEKMQVELAHRKRIKGRLAKLAKKNATSEEAMDEAEYAYQLAQSNLKAGQAEIDGIKATLAETRITVPFDAVVIRKYAEIGLVTQPGEALYQIQDQSRLKFRARVKEGDLGHIALNDEARITITALGDEAVTGTVMTIIPAGDERHTFVVELELPQKPGLYPGMFGKAVFN